MTGGPTVDDVPEDFVAATVDGAGGPLDPEWVDAFRAVPRSVFVPRFFGQNAELAWEPVERPSPRWVERVWRDVPLITQLDGDDGLAERAAEQPLRRGNATSSSSQPSLVALMLQALDVRTGQRVLEIGTGSGYNAGLLCHRLGDASVVSVDVDDGVTARARERLAGLGLHPRVITGDGLAGCPEYAPFDRIIATVGVARLPASWTAGTAQGGKILFPLDLRGVGGLLPLLTVDGGCARGRFLRAFGGFMPVRSLGIHRDAALTALGAVADDDGVTTPTGRTAADADPEGPAGFFVALRTGGYDRAGFVPADGRPSESWFADGRGSWVCHVEDRGGRRVRQGGPRRLWTEIEAAHDEWNALGGPPRERFELTVTPDGTHRIRLDPPSGPAWAL